MNGPITSLPLVAFLTLFLCGCGSVPRASRLTPLPPTLFQTDSNRPLYAVRAGGPHTVVGLTNAPAANPVTISGLQIGNDKAIFRLTNQEPVNIMIWNVRVQVLSKGNGTDGQGWDTVHDDYPAGNKLARIPPGGVDQIEASRPDQGPWRVCVLYSKERKVEPNPEGRREYTGNYEVVSRELNP